MSASGLIGSGLRDQLERAMGVDLSEVLIYRGAQVDALGCVFGADAFVLDKAIGLVSGVDTSTESGRRILAHEVAHRRAQLDGAESGSSVAIEARADALAEDFLRRSLALSYRASRHVRSTLRCHSSWEHRLLGDSRPVDLGAIAHKLPEREKLLLDLRDFLWMWHQEPEAVTDEEIAERYPYIGTVKLKKSGLLVTYGELNTLPDYLPNPTVLDEQPKEILLPILQGVRQEGYAWVVWLLDGTILPQPFNGAVSVGTGNAYINKLLETKALDSLTWNIGPDHTNHYTSLVGRNACHFAPFSWYRWEQFYLIAAQKAREAHAATSESARAGLAYEAHMNVGYADHFLQDSFAAGHLVNKTLVMQWFIEWAAHQRLVPVTDWPIIKNVTTANQPGLAGGSLYGPAPGIVRDPQTAEEQATRQERMDVSGVQAYGDADQSAAYDQYLTFLQSTVTQSASGAAHDHFNESSLSVASEAHPAAYQIWGDDTMLNGGDGVRIASETSHMSQQSIQEILAGGESDIDAASIRRHFPTKAQITSGKRKGDYVGIDEWNESIHELCTSTIFPKVHYYLLKAYPRIKYISVDQTTGAGLDFETDDEREQN